MQITFADRRFSITLLPLLLVVVMTIIMLKLGVWQLDRATQKKALLNSLESAVSQQTQVLYKVPKDFEMWQYRKIAISGEYIADKQFLLDNQFSGEANDKRAGYNVLTPFTLQDGSTILVNRGWLPRKASKADLPDITIPLDILSIKGIVRLPAKGFSLGDISQADSTWPKLIQFIDIKQLSTISGLSLQPVIIMLLPDEKAGYERYWQTKNNTKMGPAVHYGYAFQWFALTATLIILSLTIVIKKSKKVST